jgi:hypothetical protein
MNDGASITLLVIDVFEQLQIPYLVGGSLASTVHGTARSTLDADLVAALRAEDVPILVERLQDQFYLVPEAIHEAIHHHSSFNLIHLSTIFKVDVLFCKIALLMKCRC